MPSSAPPHELTVPVLPLERFRPLVGAERYASLVQQAARTRAAMAGRTVWNVNSAAVGGGVAELLQVLVGYGLGAGLTVRWLVIDGSRAFFDVTKRLHNQLHGAVGDGRAFADAEENTYRSESAANAAALVRWIRPGDVVVLHDPQTAAMAEACKAAGATVIWRCHIGADRPNDRSEGAWEFLRPHLSPCDAYVFTRRAYVPGWVPPDRAVIIPPSIDPFSPKNQDLPSSAVEAILDAIGVWKAPSRGATRFTRRDGSSGEVTCRVTMVGDGPLDTATPLVVQVSRWDRLKDMQGVLSGFSTLSGSGSVEAQLALVGPDVTEVHDDPEGRAVLEECTDAWGALPHDIRRNVRLVTVPMTDVDENAAMVNAIQRAATVVVQKSLAEGFGLTVAEAMWKAKPVLASAVGGIVDQVAPGTGVLLDDPADLDAFGSSLRTLLTHPEQAAQIGRMGRSYVTEHFVGDVHLMRYGALLESLASR